MAGGRYSFLDIAVMDEVRQRFAQGDALAVLSPDLATTLWANGPGAALLGFADIETAMGAPAGLSATARRQIMAAPGFPRLSRERVVLVRLGDGPANPATTLLVGYLPLPDGEPAILLARPAAATDDRARRAVAGFRAEAGFFAAILDGSGTVRAASDGFEGLGFAPQTLLRLADEVGGERDRLVKRLAPVGEGLAGERLLPVGVARLADEPAVHLLVAVDEEGETQPAPAPDAAAPEVPRPATQDASRQPEEHGEDEALPAAQTGEEQTDDWYFSRPDENGAGSAAARAEAAPPLLPLDPAPLRFVWRTDAQGRFSALSDEFLAATGTAFEEVMGHPFRAVAHRLGIDPKGEIAGLLERRDTWSGRMVAWPVRQPGNSARLRVPVDLAALPVYDRERNFEGFRGFGVARMGEAMAEEVPAGDDAPGETSPGQPAAPEEAEASYAPAGDKVIQLAERRPTPPEPEAALSSSERNAFREIGDRLKREYGPPEEPKDENREKARPAAPTQQDAEPAPSAAPEEPPAAQEEAPPPPDAPPPAEQEEASPPSDTPVPASREEMDGELLDALPVAVLVHAGERLHFANRAFLSLTGYADLDEIGRAGGLDRLFVEGGPRGNHEAPEGGRLRLRPQEGEAFAVAAHLRVVRWAGASALMLTLQRGPEEAPAAPEAVSEPEPDGASAALAQMEQRIEEMRAIIDTATDGVVLIAPDGAIRHVSRPAEALFGLDGAELEGRPFASLFAIESRKAAADYLDGLAGNGVASVLNDGREVIGREREGRFIPLFMTIGKLPQEGGYCAVLRDITQWKRAEEELTQARAQAERASSQKTEFLARVSHEIRTPLNAIIGFSELMMDEKFGPIGSDRYRDYLRDINRSGNHVLDLVNDLLDISKIEAGEQEMQYEAVSLNEALAEAVAMMQPQANRERVIIRSSLASRVPEVVADLRSVRQIALNLLSNAIRYTQAGGQVVISTAHEASGDVVMRVRDTGIGMTLAEIDQALKPFKQINALKRERHDGTGLGLPLTKAMVEANRARFSISSVPGEGTLVEIVFPSTRVLAD